MKFQELIFILESKIPSPLIEGGYGSWDWTPSEWASNQVPRVRNGFLGISDEQGVRGRWYADVLTVDHTEVGYKHGSDRFRYMPHYKSGALVWNYADETVANQVANAAYFVEKNGWPLKHKHFDWANIRDIS